MSSQAQPSNRLFTLRALLKEQGVDGFVVPRTDEYQGENIAPYAQRLKWQTGFTGSSGTAVILPDVAALFVDGRYTLQAEQQVNTTLYLIQHIPIHSIGNWLKTHLKPGQYLGFDPWLHTRASVQRLKTACEANQAILVPLPFNPIDQLWHDQPARPHAPFEHHPLEYAGESSDSKISRLATGLKEQGITAAIITALDSIAWLSNIRGNDIPYAPLVLASGILWSEGRFSLYMDETRLSNDLRDRFKAQQYLEFLPSPSFESQLTQFGSEHASMLIDPSLTPERIVSLLEEAGAQIAQGDDPCLLPKACKNPIEVQGMINAHRRDGIAVVKFLSWLEDTWKQESLTELSAAEKLYSFRAVQNHFRGPSFPTISAIGPHGAIVHYIPSEQTNRPLDANQIYLVDSGGQYLDGTTDITRTIILGIPTAAQRDHFTRVLKGHIRLAGAIFPEGTSGVQLEALARIPLWQAGLDYEHGTGHGVGSYLCVHEGPQRISKFSNVALQPGMVVSNEPGYYKNGSYGIRIENLMVVNSIEISHAESPRLCFETLTMVPICLDLVDPTLLEREELQWLNAYHRSVYETLQPSLSAQEKAWLARACRPLEAN